MVAKISTQIAVMPIAHFASEVNQGVSRSRMLKSTQAVSPMMVKRVNSRLIVGRYVLKAINAAYPNMTMARRDRICGFVLRNSANGLAASRKKSPLVAENMAFAFRMWCKLD